MMSNHDLSFNRYNRIAARGIRTKLLSMAIAKLHRRSVCAKLSLAILEESDDSPGSSRMARA